jgi:ATP-binding cassette subfamily F protein uup
MDKMVDHLFVFEGQGKIRDIVGNYTEFRKNIIEIQRQEKNDKIVQEKQVDKLVEKSGTSILNEKRKFFALNLAFNNIWFTFQPSIRHN